MTRTAPLLSLLFVLPFAAAQPAPTTDQLLAHVPPQTAFALVAPRVDKLVSALAGFGRAIGDEDLAELTPTLLIERAGLLEHAEGLDVDGPVVLAQGAGRGVPLALCVVRDADAWKTAVQAEELDNGMLRVRLCHAGGYAAIKGNVLIIADAQDAVRSALAADGTFAQRFQKQAGPLLADHQLVCWMDLSAWRPHVEAALTALHLAMQMGMAMNASQDETSRRFVNAMVGELGAFVREIESVSIGIQGGAEGIRLKGITRFRAGGPAAEYLTKVGKGKGHLLRGLPNDEPMLAVGCEWEKPPGTDSLTLRWLKTLFDSETTKARVGEERYDQAIKASIAMNNGMSGYNFTMRTGQADEGMLITGLYFADDPAEFMKNLRDSFEFNAEFLNPFGTGAMMDVAPRSEEIAGHEVATFDIAFPIEDKQLLQVVHTMYGRQTRAYAAPRAQDVVFVMGPTSASRQQVERLLTATDGQLTDDPRVVAISRALSPEPQCCALLDLVEFFKFVLTAARAAGAPVPPLEWSSEPAPYAGLALYFEPEQIRMEAFVPAEPLRRILGATKAMRAGERAHRP